MHTCPKCQQPLREEPQLKYVKIDGEWNAVPGTSTYTCLNPACPRQWITLNLQALTALTDEQAATYPTKRTGASGA